MSSHLVIGCGEVGKAVQKVFDADGYDIKGGGEYVYSADYYKHMHICFPYSDQFKFYVQGYQSRFKPNYTIIHSTVPVGTSRKLNAIHSPIRGLHPNLYEGLLTFPKFIGGEQASEVADEFRKHGMKVILCDKQEETEAMKLFDTEYYRVCIEFAQRVKRFCNKHDLSFSDVYRISNITYNEAYTKLNHAEYVRPVLEPIMKEISGHCVLPNSELLKMSE
jgi:hypothetical protein